MKVNIKGDEFGIMPDRVININEVLLNSSVFSEWAKVITTIGKEKTKDILRSNVCQHMSLTETLRVSRFISTY